MSYIANNIMKIKVSDLVKKVDKALVAVPKEDKLVIAINENAVLITAFNSLDLQITTSMKQSGSATQEVYVKGTSLHSILLSYVKLGVKEIEVEFGENEMTFREPNEEGTVTLTYCDKPTILPLEKPSVIGVVLVKKDILEEALKAVEYTADPNEITRKGVYFQAEKVDKGNIKYRLFATDACNGALETVSASIKLPQATSDTETVSQEEILKNLSFFTGAALSKALSVMEGEFVNIMVTAKRLYLRDSADSLAFVNLNSATFPTGIISTVLKKENFKEKFSAVVDSKEFTNTIGLCLAVAEKDKIKVAVKIKVEDGIFTISDMNDRVKRNISANIQMAEDKQTDVQSSCFNAERILSAISKIRSEKVTLIVTEKMVFIKSSSESEAFAFSIIVASNK